jgi:hypothetical protein
MVLLGSPFWTTVRQGTVLLTSPFFDGLQRGWVLLTSPFSRTPVDAWLWKSLDRCHGLSCEERLKIVSGLL